MPINKNVFIKNYLSALNNGDAAIFAGAGLSAPSGCVNWKQLLREIAEELELDIEKESDLVAIAQYYYNKNGCNRTKLNDIIKDAFQTGKQPNVNHNNRYNQHPKVYSCNQCKCVNALTGSYIAFVEEDEFLSNPQKYINNAYDKSEKDAEGYNLTKQR